MKGLGIENVMVGQDLMVEPDVNECELCLRQGGESATGLLSWGALYTPKIIKAIKWITMSTCDLKTYGLKKKNYNIYESKKHI